MDLIKYPKGYCPKCGIGEAFSNPPSYREGYKREKECLEYRCHYCGFIVRTHVLLAINEPIIEEDIPF